MARTRRLAIIDAERRERLREELRCARVRNRFGRNKRFRTRLGSRLDVDFGRFVCGGRSRLRRRIDKPRSERSGYGFFVDLPRPLAYQGSAALPKRFPSTMQGGDTGGGGGTGGKAKKQKKVAFAPPRKKAAAAIDGLSVGALRQRAAEADARARSLTDSSSSVVQAQPLSLVRKSISEKGDVQVRYIS